VPYSPRNIEETVLTLTINDFDEDLVVRLAARAKSNGRSSEEEVKEILRQALADSPAEYGLGTRIRQRVAEMGGVELELPNRSGCAPTPELR
jgi:antitoxin FitA